jgi:NTE family protein
VAGEPGYDQARVQRERDRLARRLTGRRLGLALSSGGAHGLAHIGVIHVLERAGIPIDMVSGTSMGSIIGSSYAAGRRGRDLYRVGRKAGSFLALRTGWRLWDIRLSRSGFVRGDVFEQHVADWTFHKRFEDLEIPFFTVAAEVISGQAVVFSKGPVAHGVRASCSVPGFISPVPYGDDFLMDGAAVDPVPCKPLADAGADIIIACNVIPQVADRLYRRVNRESGRAPSFLDVSHSESEIMAAQIAILRMWPYDVLIAPRVGKYHWREASRMDEFIRLGIEAAQAEVPRIKQLLQPGARAVHRQRQLVEVTS